MKKFSIDIERKISNIFTVDVEAENMDEAVDKAIAVAQKQAFYVNEFKPQYAPMWGVEVKDGEMEGVVPENAGRVDGGTAVRGVSDN